MAGRFELSEGAGALTVAASKAYMTKAAAKNGNRSARKNAPDVALDDQTQ